MRLLVLALLCAVASPVASAKTIDVLKEKDFWVLENTSEDIYTIDELKIRAKRRSFQSATILSREDYENYRLTFDLNLQNDCELVLMLHAPRNGAYPAGQELMLGEQMGKPISTYVAGALFNKVAPKVNAIKKDGQWNSVVVEMNWPTLKVVINEQVVQDIDLSANEDLKYTLRRGAIGFRDLLGWGYQLENVQLETLPDTEDGIELFNGKNLKGWSEVRPGAAKWSAEDGVIIGRDGDGYLQHKQVTQNFDLRLYYRASPTANGGVFFRWKSDDSERGNEIQILDVPQTYSPSGSIYNIKRSITPTIRPNEWHLLQIIVHDNHAVTLIDGVKTAESDELINLWPGHITLQMHKQSSTIEFKDFVLVVRD
jgi:hypothetical protein